MLSPIAIFFSSLFFTPYFLRGDDVHEGTRGSALLEGDAGADLCGISEWISTGVQAALQRQSKSLTTVYKAITCGKAGLAVHSREGLP